MNHNTAGLPVHHQLPESTQTHVHWVGDAIKPSYLLSSPSPPALNLSQHQGLFQWVRWPKYWSFSISPSNEYSGSISFRIDCFNTCLLCIWCSTNIYWMNFFFFLILRFSSSNVSLIAEENELVSWESLGLYHTKEKTVVASNSLKFSSMNIFFHSMLIICFIYQIF